jgi:hypothetical protein
LIAQNQTTAALTFTQPLTPLLQLHQAVRIARADERIAMAKAGVSVTKNALDRELEETNFKLLIVQCKLTAAQFRSIKPASRALYAATSSQLIRASDKGSELPETNLEFSAEATEVRQLATSLTRLTGWPDDTELELVPPKPLVENVSLEEVAAKSLAANPDVMEAEQTVVKARAASMILEVGNTSPPWLP